MYPKITLKEKAMFVVRSRKLLFVFLRFTNWKKKRKFRFRRRQRFRLSFRKFSKLITGRSLFYSFIRIGKGIAFRWKKPHTKLHSRKQKRRYFSLFHRYKKTIIKFYYATTKFLVNYQGRSVVSLRRLFRAPFQTNIFYLRHFEINARINSFLLLPIPYTFFYSFLLDQTFLWKTLMIDLHAAYKKR